MQTALRKMGNSTGMIVPRSLLSELGASSGTAMDIRVEDGRLVATPVTAALREGWAAAAEAIAEEDGAAEWREFANEDDADLLW